MARKQDKSNSNPPDATHHPLLVYYNLGKRYRPPGILLFLTGLVFFLPSFVSDLKNDLVEPEALAQMGAVVTLAGVGFWLFSILAKRRAYVLCRPDLLEIRTPFYRVMVSYLRVKQVQSVQVSQLFPKESLKRMGKPLVKPLLGMTAVEMQVRSWPTSKRRLKRYMGKYLFSPRVEGWVFIVPNYSILMRQIEEAQRRKGDRERASTYEDPFERMRRSSK
jgi:hypothetical protein